MFRKLLPLAALTALAALVLLAPGASPALAQCPASAPAAAGDTADFRAQNDLVAYEPPPWFLQGAFVARESEPRYVFASPEKFARALGCPTSWLIEAAEIKRLERAAQKGQPMEYSLYLEARQPSGTVYWMFVALPYQSAQEWFQDRWTYHRSKAEGFYGKTQAGLERAAAAGLWPKGELRYLVMDGQVSLDAPEDLLVRQMSFPAVYDLAEGRALGKPAAPAAPAAAR